MTSRSGIQGTTDGVAKDSEPFNLAANYVADLQVTLGTHHVVAHVGLSAKFRIPAPRGAAGRARGDRVAGVHGKEGREEMH